MSVDLVSTLISCFSHFLFFGQVEEEAEEGEEASEDTSKESKKKTITEKYWDWELINETKPIWVSRLLDFINPSYLCYCHKVRF